MRTSVALCTYNGAKYLKPQLDSILKQSHAADEIIICDDQSTDRTWEVLSDYQRRHPKTIKLHRNDQRLGVTKNFEKAIRLCEGDLIALSDQDDVWNPKKLERQITELNKQNASLVVHNAQIVDESLSPIDDVWSRLSYTPGTIRKPHHSFEQLLHHNVFQGATFLFHTGLREYLLPIPESWIHDYFIALIASVVGTIYDADQSLLLYRQHDQQMIGLKKLTGLEQFLNSMNVGYEYYKDNEHMWKEFADRIQNIDAALNINKEILMREVHNRAQYERNRAKAANWENPLRMRLEGIASNIRQRNYARYGLGRKSLLKDVYAAIIGKYI